MDSEEKYISIESNLALYENRLIFTHPENGNLMYLPIQIIDEVLIILNEETLVFRTTKGKKFDPVISDIEFYQVLYSNGTTVIKVTSKKLIPADYQRVYSADRRYDEFDTKYTYYYLGPDVLFHKFAPNKKSLLTIFPDKHELITNTLSNREFENKDQMVLEVIKRIASSTFMCAALSEKSSPDEELNYAVSLINRVVEGMNGKMKTALHVCRGNWSNREDVLLRGAYDPLIPYFSRMNVNQFVLEYATEWAGSIEALAHLPPDKEVGLGVVDPRTMEVETVDFVVNKVKSLLKYRRPEQICLNPDCVLWYVRRPSG